MLHYKGVSTKRWQKVSDIVLIVFGCLAMAYTTVLTVKSWIVGDAQYSFPGAAFGLVLGTARLARRVGTAQARQWVRSGEVFAAQAALQTGFASRR